MMKIVSIFADNNRENYNTPFKGLKPFGLLPYETVDTSRVFIKSFNDIFSVVKRKSLEGIIELQKLYEDISLFPNDKGVIFKSSHKYNPSVHLRINDEEKGLVFRKVGNNKKMSVNIAMPKKEGAPNLLRIYLKDNRSKPVDLFLIQDGNKVVKNVSKENPYEIPNTLEYYTEKELNELGLTSRLNNIFDLLDPYVLRLKKLVIKKSDTFIKTIEEKPSIFIKKSEELPNADYILTYRNLGNQKTVKTTPAKELKKVVKEITPKAKTAEKPVKEKKVKEEKISQVRVKKEKAVNTIKLEKPVRTKPVELPSGVLEAQQVNSIAEIREKYSRINEIFSDITFVRANQIKNSYSNLELAAGKRSFTFLNKLESDEKLSILKMDNKKNDNLLKITVTDKDDNVLQAFLIKDNHMIVSNYNQDYPTVIPPKLKFYSQEELKTLNADKYINTANSAMDEFYAHVTSYIPKLKEEKVQNLMNSFKVELNIPKCYAKNPQYRSLLTEGFEKLQKTLEDIGSNIQEAINKKY